MKPFLKGIFVLILTVVTIMPVVVPAPAYALPTDAECQQQKIGNIGCIPYFLKNVVNAVFVLSAVVAVVLIILSGIRLLLSGGDPIKVEQAKKSLTYTIVGLVIVLLSFVMINLISRLTGGAI